MMKIRCKNCSIEISEEGCVFAIYKKVIEDKEYAFCCPQCAEDYEAQAKC